MENTMGFSINSTRSIIKNWRLIAMSKFEVDGVKYESSMEYALDWCDGIRAATGAPGCYVSEEELWLESGISNLNAQKNHYRKRHNELKQKVEELELLDYIDELEKDLAKMRKSERAADMRIEKLKSRLKDREEKLEEIKTILEADCDE